MKTTSAQIVVPATVFLGLLNGVEGMQISFMPPDVAPADLLEMLNAATKHVQSLIDQNNAEPNPPEPDDIAGIAVTLALGTSQSVEMPGGGTLTVNYPDEEPPLENQGE